MRDINRNWIKQYKENFFTYNYVFFCLVLVTGLSTSEILMSIGTIGLVINWLVEGQFKTKINRLKKKNHYLPMVFILGYLSLLFWLINTQDFAYAWRDLKIKLPLLFFPLVLGTIELQKKQVFFIYRFFVFATFISTAISFLVYLGIIPTQKDIITDIRNISIFISHIRLSLLVCFSIVLVLYFKFKQKELYPLWVTIGLVAWFVYFLFLMQVVTGVLILLFLLVITILKIVIEKEKTWLKLSAIAFLLFFILGIIFHVRTIYVTHFVPKIAVVDGQSLPATTKYGEPYRHELNNKWLENGNRVWLYFAPNETKETWNKVSSIPYDSLDKKGQPMWGTLMRYLTSKGLRKDAEGVYSLTAEDIKRIENGETNCCENLSGIDKRIKEIIFEVERFKQGYDPNGHSLTQRIYYLDAGIDLLKQNWLFGTGLGDIHNEFMSYYEQNNSPLKGKNRKRVHNQFVSIAVATGIIGFFIWIMTFIIPLFMVRYNKSLYYLFIIIILLSFLTDNTLERQAGVMFYAFFNSFILFQKWRE